MIILDTNVLSEPLRHAPDPGVLAWLDSTQGLVTTAISVGEVFDGVRRLPHGRRRERLAVAVSAHLDSWIGRILPYDEPAAHAYARLREDRRTAGRPISVEDGMIAGICAALGATLATRNIKDFINLDIGLLDPWGQASG